jgi:hypothetical protein
MSTPVNLTEEGRETLTVALADAVDYREPRGVCADCDKALGGHCGDHAADQDLADRYRRLAASFGLTLPS